MKIEKIKPIPKYIKAQIKRLDDKAYKPQEGKARFYAYLTKNDGELVKVTVAAKTYRKKWYCKQVAVHGVHSDKCFVLDLVFYYIGRYVVDWYSEGIQKCPKKWGYENCWGEDYDKAFDPYAPVVNKEYALKFPEYKNSQVQNYHDVDILKYLRLYEQYPQMELMMKFGLTSFVTHKSILNKTVKDKRFTKWLIAHRKEIASYKFILYAPTIIFAYKKNIDIDKAQKYMSLKNSLAREYRLKDIGKLFKGEKAIEQLISYLQAKNIDVYTYADYICACNYLHIDLTQEKNLIPHDFKRWHDERVEQQRILQEEENKKQRIEAQKSERRRKAEQLRLQKDLDNLETNFAKVVKKFSRLQNYEQNGYIMVIAKTPAELIIEGQQLHHCAGGQNYRLRMSKAKSLIFFVREIAKPDKPFVTVEYSPQKQQVLQCYGDDDIPPADDVKRFVNELWLPYANQITNKILRKKAA